MDIAKERIGVQISTQELERRWNAVRAAMKDHGRLFPYGYSLPNVEAPLYATGDEGR